MNTEVTPICNESIFSHTELNWSRCTYSLNKIHVTNLNMSEIYMGIYMQIPIEMTGFRW